MAGSTASRPAAWEKHYNEDMVEEAVHLIVPSKQRERERTREERAENQIEHPRTNPYGPLPFVRLHLFFPSSPNNVMEL